MIRCHLLDTSDDDVVEARSVAGASAREGLEHQTNRVGADLAAAVDEDGLVVAGRVGRVDALAREDVLRELPVVAGGRRDVLAVVVRRGCGPDVGSGELLGEALPRRADAPVGDEARSVDGALHGRVGVGVAAARALAHHERLAAEAVALDRRRPRGGGAALALPAAERVGVLEVLAEEDLGAARDGEAAEDVVVGVLVLRPDPLRVGGDGAEAAVVDGAHLAVDVAPRADTIRAKLEGRLPRVVGVARARPVAGRRVAVPAGVDLRPAAGLAVGGVGVPAAPALVGRVLDAVDGQGADPAASAAGVERVDADDERAADGEGVAVDGLPVAAGVRVAHHVGRRVAAGDVGAAAVDVGLVLAVDVERVGVVGGDVHGAGAGALGRARAVAAVVRAVHLAAVRGATTALVRRVAHGDEVRRAASAATLVGAAAPAQNGRVAVAAVEALQQV